MCVPGCEEAVVRHALTRRGFFSGSGRHRLCRDGGAPSPALAQERKLSAA